MKVNHRLKIAIGCVPIQNTTAIYFDRAARAAGHDVTLVHDVDATNLTKDFDLFLAIDPWVGGLEYLADLACPTAVFLIDVHRSLTVRILYSRFFDHVFVAQHDYISDFAQIGHKSVHWLPLAGDPNVHHVNGLLRDIDVGFVGKLGKLGSDRRNVISNVLTQCSTNDISHFYTASEMGKIYSRSKVVFNKSIGCEVNMRFFEAMASGALLVTDRIGNGLNELAEEGVHYVSYDTAEEAVAQIEHYLAHDADRERIAQAGQALLRQRHTYDARLDQIRRTVAAGMQASPARSASPRQRRLWRAELARLSGISFKAAVVLLANGLAPAGFVDLAIGLSRAAKRKMGGRLR